MQVSGVHFDFVITAGQIAIVGALLGLTKALFTWHRMFLIFQAEHQLLKEDYIFRHNMEENEWNQHVALALSHQKGKSNGKGRGAHA